MSRRIGGESDAGGNLADRPNLVKTEVLVERPRVEEGGKELLGNARRLRLLRVGR
jgi:hypothetical protein